MIKLINVSKRPGVYLMKNSFGHVIYIGKALNLRNRLTSYFGSIINRNPKNSSMVHNTDNFETIVTNSEKEALVLEHNLIKQFQPKYNIVLRDDKRYPLLRIDRKMLYPYLEIVRIRKKDNADYFGPFTSSGDLRKTIKIINTTFKLRKCNGARLKNKKRPCINYQMKSCLAPCCMYVDNAKYKLIVNDVKLFLKGKTPELIQNIYKKMDLAALEQKFELAAELRDKIFALKNTLESQLVFSNDFANRDVFEVVLGSKHTIITTLFIRGGVLQGTQHFTFKDSSKNKDEVLSQFLIQFYEKDRYIPDEILIPNMNQYFESIEEILSVRKNKKVKIIMPIKGNKKKLVTMARINAKNKFREQIEDQENISEILLALKNNLGMITIPNMIECFDNSNLFGTNAVAAMVAFKNGKPFREHYRKYIIKTVDKNDDYAYMREVLMRRFKKDTSLSTLPNLLMIDGGLGHLNIALSVLKVRGLGNKFLTIGIAKKNKNNKTDKVYIPGKTKPVDFKNQEQQLLFLQKIRDEAHRSALSFHRHLREKNSIQSTLDKIKGIGTQRKALLLKQFGDV